MTTYQVQRIQTAVVRYLLGNGDPYPQRVSGLLDEETLRQNQLDSGYRARRLVKVTSGLSMMPTSGRRIKVCFTFIILKAED